MAPLGSDFTTAVEWEWEYSLHAGQVIVADGTEAAASRLERVLTGDPAMGVLRHVDAGYQRAIDVAHERAFAFQV